MKIVAYSLCAINSLLLLLMAVDYLFIEVDLFLWVWMSLVLLFVTVPLGLAFFVYSLFHLRHKEGRVVAIWTLAMAAVVFVVFWLLPSGVSRVPAKMESHCLQHEDHMLALARRLYSVMPDSTLLEYTPSGGVSIECIDTVCNIWGHPILKDSCMLDSGALAPIPIDSIDRVLEMLHCDRLILYKPTGLALYKYLVSGFASYWFEMSLTPYTDEDKQNQLQSYNTIPFSTHVCFRFHGGATDSDGPFPYKDQYLHSNRP